MITLDSSVLIAHFNAFDPSHKQAFALLENALVNDLLLYIHPINHAEVLVRAAERGEEEGYSDKIERIGVRVLAPPPDAGVRLARMRARTGLRMPDCCVIIAAHQSGSSIATFDERLAREARRLGIEVLPEAVSSIPA